MNEDVRKKSTSNLIAIIIASRGAPSPLVQAATEELNRRVPVPVQAEDEELVETLVAMVRRVGAEVPSKRHREDVEADLVALLKSRGR